MDKSVLVLYPTKVGFRWKLTAPPRPGKKHREVVARGGEPFSTRSNAFRAFDAARRRMIRGLITVKNVY